MAALRNNELNLVDVVSRIGADENLLAVAELLDEVNESVQDYVFIEGTGATENLYSVRTKLPPVTRRAFNERVQPGKSGIEKRRATFGNYEAWLQNDIYLLKLHSDKEGQKMREAKAQLEAMSQEVGQDVIYGDERATPTGMTGVMPYYNDLGYETVDNVIDAGGTGTDNRSILVTVWGDDFLHLSYPKGSMAGLDFHDFGEQVSESGAGTGSGLMRVDRCHFKQEAGLCLRDWRGVVRICNIDYSDYWANWWNAGANQPGQVGRRIPDYLFRALEQLPPMAFNAGNRVTINMSRRMKTILQQQLAHAGMDSFLTVEDVGGRRTSMFQGFPIRINDRMGIDEARVT